MELTLTLKEEAKQKSTAVVDSLTSDAVLARKSDTVVIAVEGNEIAHHLADSMESQFEVMPCKEVKHPADSSKSIGSVSEDEVFIHGNNSNIPGDYIFHQVAALKYDTQSEARTYLKGRNRLGLAHKTVILVYDHLVNSDSVMACLNRIRKQQPHRILMAVTDAAYSAIRDIAPTVDEIMFLPTDH